MFKFSKDSFNKQKPSLGSKLHTSLRSFIKNVNNNFEAAQLPLLKEKWAKFKEAREMKIKENKFGYFNLGGQKLSIPVKYLEVFPNSEFARLMKEGNGEKDGEGYYLVEC